MIKYIISAGVGAGLTAAGFIIANKISNYDTEVMSSVYNKAIIDNLGLVKDPEVLGKIIALYQEIETAPSAVLKKQKYMEIIKLIDNDKIIAEIADEWLKEEKINADIRVKSYSKTTDSETTFSTNRCNDCSEDKQPQQSISETGSAKVEKVDEEPEPDEALKLAKELANKFAKKGSRNILIDQLYKIFNNNILSNPMVLSEFAQLALDGDHYEQSAKLNDLMDRYENIDKEGDDTND